MSGGIILKNKIILSFGILLIIVSMEDAKAGMISAPIKPVEETIINETNIIPSKSVSVEMVSNTSAYELALKLAEGKSYVWGGNSEFAVDCSAFTQQFIKAYKGFDIPRVTFDQVKVGIRVENPEPGDLVFFNEFSHVGVYVGSGMMVDALNPDEGVGLRAVNYVHGKVDGYYRY